MDQVIAMTQSQLRTLVKEASAAKVDQLKAERAHHRAETKRCSDEIKKESRKKGKLMEAVSRGFTGSDLQRLVHAGAHQGPDAAAPRGPDAEAPPGRAPEGPGVSAA